MHNGEHYVLFIVQLQQNYSPWYLSLQVKRILRLLGHVTLKRCFPFRRWNVPQIDLFDGEALMQNGANYLDHLPVNHGISATQHLVPAYNFLYRLLQCSGIKCAN